MIPQEITRDHILKAIEQIDAQGVPSSRESTVWLLKHNEKLYPPKYVITIAGKYALDHEHDHKLFSGGPRTNNFLESRGFTIVPKGQVDNSDCSYWALLANPKFYRIEDAVNELEEDTWTTGKSNIKKGDKCIIWKAKGNTNSRGIIAIAEVLTDQVVIEDTPESLTYWIGDYEPTTKKRVQVKYSVPHSLPIWIHEDNTGILKNLSVSRGQGTVFKITSEQWSNITKLIYYHDTSYDITNKVLLKTVGKSQFQDGVRINKEFHDIFNPPNSSYYVDHGQSRPITINFNNKIFNAKYMFEGTRTAARVLQRIQFSRELINEFKTVFPNAEGFFRIKLGNDVNNFKFLYDTKDASEVSKKLEDDVAKSRLDNRDERQRRLSNAKSIPEATQVTSIAYIRNADVIAEVLCRSNGVCENCNCNAPFMRRKDGTPYLEVHHKTPLSEGGYDTVENAIGVCPNCHRELHYG